MFTPSFNLKSFVLFEDTNCPITFTLNGNNNIVLRRSPNAPPTTNLVTVNGNTVSKLVMHLVSSGAGTNKGIGKIGDISKVGVGKVQYVMVSKSTKDDEIPKDDEVYNRRLIKPDRFTILTFGDIAFKMDCNIITDLRTNNKSLVVNFVNLPVNGITFPTTVTDGFTNWLSYWFGNEAVAMRLSSKRDKKTKFKGHHNISDIYTTKDTKNGELLLVSIFNDKHPVKCLIFSLVETRQSFDVRVYEHDIITNVTKFITDIRTKRMIDPDAVIDEINTNPKTSDYKIKTKADVFGFTVEFNKWVRQYKANIMAVNRTNFLGLLGLDEEEY